MVKSSREKIFEFIQTKGKSRVEDLRHEFGLGRSILHRHLNRLLDEKLITKTGKPPLVYYIYSEKTKKEEEHIKLPENKEIFLEENYLYVSPSGRLIYGSEGFKVWIKNTKQDKFLRPLVDEYIKSRKSATKMKDKLGLLNGTKKIQNTFDKVFLEELFFADFYSLSKFGKTILGQKILYAKQAQVQKLIEEISKEIKPLIDNFIKEYDIQSVCFAPHTIPRKLQFLKELKKNLHLQLPHITLTKAYPGDIPVAQKTLSKLEERIKNARNTIFVKDQVIDFRNTLIIDDAIGSGSTLNEIATKIKKISPKIKVYGFAVVGSYKGFDVISEV